MPGKMDCEAGLAESEKLPKMRLTVPVWETLPEVPIMEIVYVPEGVELAVVIPSVEFVEGPLSDARLSEAGLKL